MNLPRIFASAIARRVAYVVVAAALAWAGLGDARAQAASTPECSSGSYAAYYYCRTRAEADAGTEVAAQAYLATKGGGTVGAKTYSAGGSYNGTLVTRVSVQAFGSNGSSATMGRVFPTANICSTGQVWNAASGECQKPCTSVERPPSTVPRSPLTGSLGCNTGCVVNYANNGDDTSTVTTTGAMCGPDFKNQCPTGTFWNGAMALCQPFEPTCPKGQVKKEGVCAPEGKCPDGMVAVQGTTPGAVQSGELYCKAEASECPAGNIKAPATGKCIPGDGQCAAGEARGKDGTCKKDNNNDGKPDEEEGDQDPNKDSASGGDSCDSPPSCSGNAIQCMQVKIQWRIDCNTRRQVNISGGSCDAVPICTGKGCNAMEYASLMQQWKAACALDKLVKKDSGEQGTDATDGNKNGVADALEGGIAGNPTETPSVTKFGAHFSTSVIDRENIFGSGSCPEPPSFTLAGQSISGGDFPYWCQAMAILRGLILIFGAYTALKILMGWGF